MYITEISLKDFRRLGLVGYQERKITDESTGYWHLEPVAVELRVSESDVEYSKSFKHKDIAVFYNDAEDYESPSDAMALHKYYVRSASTFCVWCGVEHVYSEKGRWVIKADSECGAMPKRLFDKVYLIHVED